MFNSRRITLGGDVFRDERAWTFDGTNTSVLLGSEVVLDGPFTICGWVRTDGTDTENHILGTGNHGVASANQTMLRIDPASSRISTRINAGAGGSHFTGLPTSHLKWHFFQFNRDASNDITAYLDGVKSGDTDSSESNDLHITTIGESSNAVGWHHYGDLSEIAVYKGVEVTEHNTMYNGREPFNHMGWRHKSSLELWYRFGDGTEGATGLTVYDMSSNSNNGTAENIDASNMIGTVGGY